MATKDLTCNDCEAEFTIIYDADVENGVEFCPFCGNPMDEPQYDDTGEEDDDN